MQSNKKKKDVDLTKVTCQRCLLKGHWTYQCTGKPAYLSRPSRTQLMRDDERKREEKKRVELLQRFSAKPQAQKTNEQSSDEEDRSVLQESETARALEANAAKRSLFPARPQTGPEASSKKQRLESTNSQNSQSDSDTESRSSSSRSSSTSAASRSRSHSSSSTSPSAGASRSRSRSGSGSGSGSGSSSSSSSKH